jgi:hypothetical protein
MRMNRLIINKQCIVLAALVEGNSINSTVRMTGVAKHMVLNPLEDVGWAVRNYKTTDTWLPCISCTTTSADSTRHRASRPLWKREEPGVPPLAG